MNKVLRRLIAILLLAVFSLPLALPLFALGQNTEAGLPACCRRNGQHHCAMSVGERSRLLSQDPCFRTPIERCPMAPSSTAPLPPNLLVPPAKVDALYGDLISCPTGVAQTESKRRISRDRSRQKRGPPAQELL